MLERMGACRASGQLTILGRASDRPGAVRPCPAATLSARDESAPRHHARGQRFDMGADIARAGEPDAVAVLEDVLEGAAELADAVRTAGDEWMERDRTHQGLARGLIEQLVELVDDQIGELRRG